MKKVVCILTVIFLSFAAGCEKNDVETSQSEKHLESNHESLNRFQQADEKITLLTDQIENTALSLAERQNALCIEYPKVYREQYIPAFLALKPQDTNQQQLIQDMQFTLDYYQKRLSIKC